MPADDTPDAVLDAVPVLDAIRLTVGDEVLVLDLDITPSLAGALRQQSHQAWRFPSLMEACAGVGGPGPEEVAGLLFLARRQNGDLHATYDKVAASITTMAGVEVEFTTLAAIDAEDPDSPEA